MAERRTVGVVLNGTSAHYRPCSATLKRDIAFLIAFLSIYNRYRDKNNDTNENRWSRKINKLQMI